MPYGLAKMKNGWFVVNKDTGKKYSKRPHPSKESAVAQLRAIEINTHGK